MAYQQHQQYNQYQQNPQQYQQYPQQHQQYPPQQQQQHQQPQSSLGHNAPGGILAQSDYGNFQGGSYAITHRDTNSVLNIDLQQGGSIRGKPGSMIHMAGSIQLTGKTKFSMMKMFTGDEMHESTFAGHGKVALAPTLFGDIVTLHCDGRTPWKIGRDTFLACTQDLKKEYKSQGFGKAMFSGEDLFVYNVVGSGIMWLTSFGAVDKLDVSSPCLLISGPLELHLSTQILILFSSLNSSQQVNHTSSTMAISSRGAATTRSKRPAEGSCRPARQARVWSAVSPDRARYTFRLATWRNSNHSLQAVSLPERLRYIPTYRNRLMNGQ